MAGEVGLSVLGKIGELLIEPIQRELGYFFCFNNNFQELQTQLEKLIAMKNDVQAREDAEMRKRNTLGEIVKLWIDNADGIIVEAKSLLNEKAEVQKGCFSIKWCPNISLRFSLGRKGKKLSVVIIELVQSGAQLPQTGHALPVSPINIGDYIGDARDFNSRSQIVEDIIEKLRDEKTMLIGICGMGGIGKTTLAKQVLQKVQDFPKPLFDVQVISTVSNSPNFNTIQQEVAEMLGSSLKEIENGILRAEQLRKAFSNKKVVVLLDDVWKEFDLNAFGFPLTKSNVDGSFCKIIYTSRNKDSLWSGERNITKQEFSLDILSDEESLTLFKRKVNLPNDDIEKNEIARQIVKECAGLPLALEVVGGALVNKRTSVWNDMLYRLQSQQLHHDKIDKVVQTSYDFLEDPNARSLFLFCCLFQEDEEIPIETLYRYVVGLQLFKGMNLHRISDRVETLLDDLTKRNLLINVKEYAVKMHDVVRDVGISIAKQENNGINYLECDGMDELENIDTPHTKMISILFRKNNLDVPNTVEFRGSKLELLRLDSSNHYLPNIKISWNLPKVADNLKVINIVCHLGKISEFPSKLKMLSLERLSLDMSVSSIGHIKCLEILSLRDSTIKDLSNEISELTNLRLLDLTRCKCFIFNGVLSKLTNLEELYMWESFQDWRLQKKDVNGGDNHAAGIDELNYLHKLWKLELEVPNIEQVPRGVMLFSSSTLLEQFKIRIGGECERTKFEIRIGGGCERTKFESGKRQLWLENDINNTTSFLHELGGIIGVSTVVEEQGGKSIEFPNLKELDLEYLDKLTSIVVNINNLDDEEEKAQQRTLFGHDEVSFPRLDELIIDGLPKINYIVGWKEGGRQGKGHHNKIFPVLRRMELRNLSNLIHVYEMNQPGLGVLLFQNLTYLQVGECGKLRYLFSENIGRVAANHLASLDICECPMMEVVMKNIEEEVIIDDKAGVGGGGSNSHFFPLLGRLTLLSLSGLRSFCDVAYTWELSSLNNLWVSRCPKLEALSPGFLDSPMLGTLFYGLDTVYVKDTWKGDINAALRHIKTLLSSQSAWEIVKSGIVEPNEDATLALTQAFKKNKKKDQHALSIIH
ncbi:disease resistance protein UNI-like [Impatiens glandulifera]|uniref:disease resistance protein UNI-like n=1 Tax=Impatiens glandulifera TaxID=253017 RepID=UPI001FB0DAEC|nr:disease resistance protein UNI-like [Impatiens glandulifera]